jgi:hypothetical protein
MSYDCEDDAPPDPTAVPVSLGPPQSPRDLEVLEELIGLAAVILSPRHGTVFSFESLLGEAQALGGPECPIEEGDVRIVVQYLRTLRRVRGGYVLK